MRVKIRVTGEWFRQRPGRRNVGSSIRANGRFWLGTPAGARLERFPPPVPVDAEASRGGMPTRRLGEGDLRSVDRFLLIAATWYWCQFDLQHVEPAQQAELHRLVGGEHIAGVDHILVVGHGPAIDRQDDIAGL